MDEHSELRDLLELLRDLLELCFPILLPSFLRLVGVARPPLSNSCPSLESLRLIVLIPRSASSTDMLLVLTVSCAPESVPSGFPGDTAKSSRNTPSLMAFIASPSQGWCAGLLSSWLTSLAHDTSWCTLWLSNQPSGCGSKSMRHSVPSLYPSTSSGAPA